MAVDYKKILTAYVAHVIGCEGTPFIDDELMNYLSGDEFAKLDRIGDEEYAKYKAEMDRIEKRWGQGGRGWG